MKWERFPSFLRLCNVGSLSFRYVYPFDHLGTFGGIGSRGLAPSGSPRRTSSSVTCDNFVSESTTSSYNLASFVASLFSNRSTLPICCSLRRKELESSQKMPVIKDGRSISWSPTWVEMIMSRYSAANPSYPALSPPLKTPGAYPCSSKFPKSLRVCDS